MKFAAYALMLFLMLLVALACFAPATLVDARLARLTDGRLRLADAEGPWWRGRGMLTDAAGTWRVPVAWRIVPGALAAGRLGVEFVADAGTPMPRGRLDAGVQRLGADRCRDAGAGAGVGRVRAPVGPRGIRGHAASRRTALHVDRQRGTGALALRWDDARVTTPLGLLQLGTVTLPLTARGNGVTGPLEAKGGDLRVTGAIVANVVGASVDATLTPAPGAPAGLARALGALGSADASGGVKIAWRSPARERLATRRRGRCVARPGAGGDDRLSLRFDLRYLRLAAFDFERDPLWLALAYGDRDVVPAARGHQPRARGADGGLDAHASCDTWR